MKFVKSIASCKTNDDVILLLYQMENEPLINLNCYEEAFLFCGLSYHRSSSLNELAHMLKHYHIIAFINTFELMELYRIITLMED